MSEFRPNTAAYPTGRLVLEATAERWKTAYGTEADEWLAELPDIAAQYAQRWDFSLEEPLEGGSASAVVGVTRNNGALDDAQAVLKIHPPWAPAACVDGRTAATIEATAFEILDGDCAPRLLANDTRALLLERITPGTTTPDLSARHTATLIERIAKPVPPGNRQFPLLYETIKNRYDRGFSNLHPAISPELYNSAFGVAAMLSCVVQWSLVHGDLKPKNVLQRADGTHAAIDMDPAIGHFAYDAATWAIDKPAEAVDRAQEIAERLKIDPRVIGSWVLALAIPEICLGSQERAAANLELVRKLARTSDLERYYADQLPHELHFAKSTSR